MIGVQSEQVDLVELRAKLQAMTVGSFARASDSQSDSF
jgi:hypothetical protein